MEKALLTVKETSQYLGAGLTKTRELFRTCGWSMKIGNKWYANKTLLDRWLVRECQKSKVCKMA